MIEYRSVEELVGLDGVKWDRHGADVVACWVADMDLRPPRKAAAAIVELAERGDLGYNMIATRLPEAFSQWQTRRHGWTPDPDRVRTYASVLHAIDNILWLTTEPGDGIVLMTPIYPPFLKAIFENDRRLVDVRLDQDGWRLDPDRLAQAIDPTTRVILFCNPHNPTGRTFTATECAAVARVAVENDLILISDEIWADLIHPEGKHVPMATVGTAVGDPGLDEAVARQLVTLSSVSKTFNLAATRCAVAHVSSPDLLSRLDALPSHFTGGLNAPGVAAALACWEQCEDWYQELVPYLTARRDQLAKRLAADLPSVGFQLPEATYLSWLDFSEFQLDEDAGDHLLAKAGVALNPGRDFGQHGHGFARMNVATSPEIIDMVVDRVVDALT